MSEIKIAADSGGGYISLKGPASTAGNATIDFKLPTADGSSGQYLKTDGNKNFGWVTQPTSFAKLNLTGAANSSKAAGDLWYDTDKKFHFYTTGIVGTWSNGANHPDSGYGKAGCGTLSAAITTGNQNGSGTQSGGDEYDGSAWSSITTPGTGVSMGGMTGPQTAAFKIGGYNGSATVTNTEIWNGSAWSSSVAIWTALRLHACTGTTSAALLVGGYDDNTSTRHDDTQEFDGTSWSASGDLSDVRSSFGAVGTTSAALVAGGSPGSGYYGYADEYDGTSWSQGGQLGTTRSANGLLGVPTDAVTTGGYPGSSNHTTSCEQYDGSSWSAFDALTTGRNNHQASDTGTTGQGLVVGGYQVSGPTYLNSVEELQPSGGIQVEEIA